MSGWIRLRAKLPWCSSRPRNQRGLAPAKPYVLCPSLVPRLPATTVVRITRRQYTRRGRSTQHSGRWSFSFMNGWSLHWEFIPPVRCGYISRRGNHSGGLHRHPGPAPPLVRVLLLGLLCSWTLFHGFRILYNGLGPAEKKRHFVFFNFHGLCLPIPKDKVACSPRICPRSIFTSI